MILRSTVRRRRLLALSSLSMIGLTMLLASGGSAVGAQQDPLDRPSVLVGTVDDMIGPVTALHVTDGVGRAEREGHVAYVLVLDTPGGLDTSMREITRRFLAAEVPVVVYVAPSGARAASAGAIITFASHVAAMAPGTAIGAATPVDMGGGDLDQKVVNDAAALAESLARERGRNVDFAVDTVREARSASAEEAVDIGAVDLMARDLAELLEAVDGTEVTLPCDRAVVLETTGAVTETHDMGLFRRIQKVLADPNLAFLFMSIGTLGVIYELASPGVGVGGVLGGVMIVLALFSFAVLPVNTVGFLFLLLAAALFVAELFAPGIGIFAFLGAGALVLSAIFLFDDAPGLEVSLAVLLPTVVVVAAATVVAGRLALGARSSPASTTGSGALVGRRVTVRRTDGPTAHVVIDGTWWTIRTADPAATVSPGDELEIADVEGIELIGRPTNVPTGGNRDG
jgi:membrane-bound serine protease (ClpP class)